MINKDLAKLTIDKSNVKYYHSTRKKLFFKILAFIGIPILGLILYLLIFNPVVEVEVTTVSKVYPSQMFTLLNASGYVVAQRKASVASKITAREQAKANLDNAISNLKIAKVEMNDALLHYNRQKELVSHGIVPQSEFDIAEARYKRAKAAVSAAESSIHAYKAALRSADVAVNYTYIRAPFDAVVLTKDADIGDIITPLGAAANAKAAVVTIADMDSLLVEADVSESNLQKVKVDQPCEIQLDALPETRFRGKVHMIVPTADRSKASVMIKVKFLDRDKRVLPEMSAKVAFLERPVTEEEQKPKTAVNTETVVTYNSSKFAFLIKDNHVTKVPLTTGTQIGDMVEVLDGVKPGDKVVINPPRTLKDGSRIKIEEK
ncbi:MAG: efflux RND transporter periplasmic adaptor subunit [Candidatus Jettenia sp. AMX1]|nr:MAG: efflux RND transporter periplasmic adaptor subunit [Candidatus Jettenia sp. AMX1]